MLSFVHFNEAIINLDLAGYLSAAQKTSTLSVMSPFIKIMVFLLKMFARNYRVGLCLWHIFLVIIHFYIKEIFCLNYILFITQNVLVSIMNKPCRHDVLRWTAILFALITSFLYSVIFCDMISKGHVLSIYKSLTVKYLQINANKSRN